MASMTAGTSVRATFFLLILLFLSAGISHAGSFVLNVDGVDTVAIAQNFKAQQREMIEKIVVSQTMQADMVMQKMQERPLRNKMMIRLIPIMRSQIKSQVRPQRIRALQLQIMQNTRE